jgi:TatD DNase family protein
MNDGMKAGIAPPASAAGARPSVLSLSIKEKAALYAAYMPYLKNGGIFVPTTRPYDLGDEVYLILTLLDDPTRIPVAGKVVWMSPAAGGNKTPGIGVHFPGGRKRRKRPQAHRGRARRGLEVGPPDPHAVRVSGRLSRLALPPPMYIDSHCHLSFPELAEDLAGVLARMRAAKVVGALNVCTTLPEFETVLAVAEREPNIVASVGVHPDYTDTPEPTVDRLVELAAHPKVVAIGETGLDYYRLKEPLEWQRERFRVHIRAARAARKPLIIHTRAAAEDTIRLMHEEGAAEAGGVMHCFTESRDVAQAAMAMGFYISFSGIVTFKNARELQAVAQAVPLERLLIETDAPYLAPVPFRAGRTSLRMSRRSPTSSPNCMRTSAGRGGAPDL